jgi:hypothetical protein
VKSNKAAVVRLAVEKPICVELFSSVPQLVSCGVCVCQWLTVSEGRCRQGHTAFHMFSQKHTVSSPYHVCLAVCGTHSLWY